VEVVGGKLPEIACELKKKTPLTILCRLPKEWPSPCALVLVRHDSHFPLNREDGTAVDRFAPGLKLPREVTLADPARRGGGYYRVFLDEEQPLLRTAEVKLATFFVGETR
jgi:hypothetical protein